MAALAITRESARPALLDFRAPWRGPRRMVGPAVDETAAGRPDIRAGRVNVDGRPEPAAAFGAMGIPAPAVAKGGRVIARAAGARPRAGILALL